MGGHGIGHGGAQTHHGELLHKVGGEAANGIEGDFQGSLIGHAGGIGIG